jgi:3-oxoacyl-[acyl-carrier protein] reductase
MDNPVAIIAGAGRGIGRAIALELAGRGYGLALLARSESDLNETARLAGGGLVLPTDVRRADAVDDAVRRAVDHFGRVDVLVNCAGFAPVRSLDQLTAGQWQEIVETNLSAVVYATLAVWPHFRQRRAGVIVNLSSFSARDPFPGLGAYGAAKAGVNLLGMAWAKEAREAGVRVHTIAPAAVETEMFRRIMSPEQFPTEQTLTPQEVAGVVLQCVEGDLRHTSGETIWLQKGP